VGGGPVAREIGNDQGSLGPEFAEAAAELLGGAQEPVTEHQGLSLAADEVTERLAADPDEPLIHRGDPECRPGACFALTARSRTWKCELRETWELVDVAHSWKRWRASAAEGEYRVRPGRALLYPAEVAAGERCGVAALSWQATPAREGARARPRCHCGRRRR
jgi:hypothetical protein